LHINKNKIAQVKAERIPRHVHLNYSAMIVKIDDGKENFVRLKFGVIPVSFPENPDLWFKLVIISGFGKQPMLLLTNLDINLLKKEQVWKVVEIYLTRWKCDECYRYIKQSYNLEDLRVRSYYSIRNISVLVHAIAYFCSIYLGESLKLNIMVQKIYILSKRIFGVPTFFHYAMADGIFELLKASKSGLSIILKGKIGNNHDLVQLELFPP